jgi:uronate dehydrogenase
VDERILITGAGGRVGGYLRPRLGAPGRIVRLLDSQDLQPLPGDPQGVEYVRASITDLDAMVEACTGVRAVVHLAGLPRENTMRQMLAVNLQGTHNILEAARHAGVERVVLASSNHAVGFHPAGEPATALPADIPGRPDTLYGWSKVAIEALGRLYYDRFGLGVICLRIGQWGGEPGSPRGLALWLSPDDGARLVEACLSVDAPGYRIVWGVSRNTRGFWSLAEGEAIGYHPKDDSEVYAPAVLSRRPEPDWGGGPAVRGIGGSWCDIPLGEPPQPPNKVHASGS